MKEKLSKVTKNFLTSEVIDHITLFSITKTGIMKVNIKYIFIPKNSL